MTGRWGLLRAGWLAAFALVGFGPRLVQGQLAVQGGSLGGYGASSSLGMGGGNSVLIPYGGRTEGFMPGRSGGGSSLSFRPRSSASMSGSRPSLSLSPVSGSGGMGQGGRSRASSLGSSGLGGMGQGVGSFRLGSGSGLGGSGVMPPSIGYPFRQPTSPGTTGGGAG